MKANISISTYSSNEEKKQIEEIFSFLNPNVEKTYLTKGIGQQLLQILIDLSQIDIKDIIYGGILYDLLKSAIKRLYSVVRTKKPILKIQYKEKVIFYDAKEKVYWIHIEDKRKANYREDFYRNESLMEVLKLIEEELIKNSKQNKNL